MAQTVTRDGAIYRARGRSGTPQGPQRATGGVKRAGRSPRLGGPEEYKRSTRSPGGGAWRRSTGTRPDSLQTVKDPVKRYKKRPIYRLITSPKGTLQALISLHRYNRDTVNRSPNDYLRPYQQRLEAKRVRAEHVWIGGGRPNE